MQVEEEKDRSLAPIWVWSAFLLIVLYWVADNEFGPLIKLPERRIEFVHPLSQQLDDMMRADEEVLVIGDPRFIKEARTRMSDLDVSAHYFEVAQVDLYVLVAILPAVLRTNVSMIVAESIPAYWTGEVHMAAQLPAGPINAAVQQIPGEEGAPSDAPTEYSSEYIISPPTRAFDRAEAMRLVFDNYSGYWREIDDYLVWVESAEFLSETSEDFQLRYKNEFKSPPVMLPNVGYVGSWADLPSLLEQFRALKVERDAEAVR